MTQQTRTESLASILQAADQSWRQLIDEVKSVPPDDFVRDPGDGEWSVKRQVEHAIGSELYFASLVIHALGMGNGRQWEQDRLIGVLEEVREKTLSRLRVLTPRLLEEKATHPDEGEYSVRDVISGPLTRHPQMHREYVQKVRKLLETKLD